MVTLLDAHPDIAMAYEFYPTLLVDAESVDMNAIASLLERTPDLHRAAKQMPTKGLVNLVKRAPRARLTNADIARLLRAHMASGRGFSEPADRLLFV